MAPILPLEVCALIASFVEPRALGALALVSRKLLGIVDHRRYTSPSVSSAKSFVALCDTFKRRPETAWQARRLFFDWDASTDKQGFLPLSSLVCLVSAALANATRLHALTFLCLPPQSFIGFLANFAEHLTSVHYLEYGAVHEPFDYARLDRENLLSTVLLSLNQLNTIYFHSIVPRSCLHALMGVIGNRTSPLIDTVALAVQEVDFGVIQEITLQDPTTKHERPCLADLTILGYFSRDPYTPSSTFLKDVPAILSRLPQLSRLSFIVPPSPTRFQWGSSPAVFSQEQCFLDRLGNATMLTQVMFPSGNLWSSWCDVSAGAVHWEPAPLETTPFARHLTTTLSETPLHRWWWASDSSVALVEIAPPDLLASLRPPNVAPPVPWKRPCAKYYPRFDVDAHQWLPPSYRRSTTPLSAPIHVEDIVFSPQPTDEDDEDDDEHLRLIDVDLEDAHAQLELELGWKARVDMDRLGSPTSGDESSGEDDDEIDGFAAPQRGVNTACGPHALEVQALFPSGDDQRDPLANWSASSSEIDDDDDDIDSEVEVSAPWPGPMNPAKRRMSLYFYPR